MHFAEVSDGVENFYYIDPKDSTFYASTDALCTYLLVPATFKYFQEGKYAAKLDEKVTYPLMKYEEEKIWLDGDLLKPLESEIKERIDFLEKEIYKKIGYIFNLNSPQQVSQAFQSLGIDTGQMTASGYMKTGIDELETLDDDIKDRFPVLHDYIEYKRLFKFLSSYIKVLHKEYDDGGFLRCSYKTQQVPTGRLASGKDSKNTFFSEINIQSVPKPHPMFYYVLDMKDRKLNDSKGNIINGFKFVPCQYSDEHKRDMIDAKDLGYDNCVGVAEGMDPHTNARNVIIPKGTSSSDSIWCAIDFSGQELRLTANFSREPNWVEAFTTGGDVHKNTAYAIWGKENYDKEKRKLAKGANFAVIYGASAKSFIGTGGMNETQAEEFYSNYKKGLPTLFAYQDRLVARCKREGNVYTYFGRPRRVKFYFQNNPGFAKRTVLNNPIQGTAGDVLKIIMCKLWQNVLNHPEYRDDARFLLTVHDEIDYEVKVSRLNEIARLLENNQVFELAEWPCRLDVEVSFGWRWGSLFAFEWDESQECYIPKMEN
jgi:DNA polymerase I-like protein with 3'-5' exonuclease and polymerase domains